MPDQHKNFAYSTVATAPSPATSGTSLVVASGDGATFQTTPFNATVWPASTQPSAANAEIVRVTARSTDTLTIVRAQESSTARTVVVGDQIAATITEQTIEWAERYPGKYAVFETDFVGLATWVISSGSGGAASHQGQGGGYSGHPGVMGLTTGTTAGGFVYVLATFASNSSSFNLQDDLMMEFIFHTPATISDSDMRFGAFANLIAAPTWGFWIEKLAADTDFFFKLANNGTADTRQDTGTAVSANTWYSIKLRRAGSVYYWSINRAAESAGYTGTNNTSTAQNAYVGAEIAVNGTAVSRQLDFDFMRAELTTLSR